MKDTHTKPEDGSSRRSVSGLSDLETDVMLVLWERGESTVAQVREALAQSRRLAHTTILTVLDRMCAKGAVRLVGGRARVKRYRPALPRDWVVDRVLGSIRKRFFGGSSASLVAHLLDRGEVDEGELAEIRQLLERTGAEPENGGR